MSKQKDAVSKLLAIYEKDTDVRGILLYGSVAHDAEKENSDVDMWLYRFTEKFVHSTFTIDGVKVDLFEISIPMLEKFIQGGEAPCINALLEGKILYNTDINFNTLIQQAMSVKSRKFIPIETMPQNRIIFVLLQMKDLVDDARDLITDSIKYRLVFSEAITMIYNNIYDFYGIWRESPKNTPEVFEKEMPEIAALFKIMIDDTMSRTKQVDAADKIIKLMAEKYGGIPKDRFIITEIINKT